MAPNRPVRGATLAGAVAPTRVEDGPRARAGGDETRARIVAEAAACVVDEGFAAASASRIAQRAGVTWGVIQYHFGDRAGLLSAVVAEGYRHFRECIDEADIPEGPTRARVTAIVDAGWDAYGTPLARAAFEILVNTRSSRTHDPRHAGDLVELARGRNRIGEELLRDRHAGASRLPVDQLLWAALRGFAMTMMFNPGEHSFAAERAALVEVLSAYLDDHSPR